MISVCVDLNYVFHKTFGVFSGFGCNNPGEILSKKADRNIFMRKIITDLCYTLNHLPIDGQVVIVSDSRSWRKDLKVNRAEYKGSRKDKKDKKVDWGSFFDLITEFGEFLQLNGYIYSKAGGAEGDDLLWFWNHKLAQMGSNVVIYSGDKDMHQLVEATSNRWTICWNANSKNNKIVAANGWQDLYLNQEEALSVFNISFDTDSERDRIKKVIESCVLDEIDSERLIFEKILTGDLKDDVPSVWSHEKSPGKIIKLTNAKAVNIFENFRTSGWNGKKMHDIWDSPDFRAWIAGFILRSVGSSDNADNRMLAISNYEENARLVWLSERVIPELVIDNMELSFSSKKIETRPILFDRKTMIARSPWSEDLAPSSFDPFNYKK